MKLRPFVLSGLALATLTSCYVTPLPPRARSPYSPGGRVVMPGERNPHSPFSPGGRVVLPHEARRVNHRGSVYYTHRGVWYRPHAGSYMICPRPY